ncbi:MAG: transporter substrate-binding domain-containing protein [Oscillospiraceae bacterium]|nr:transporter substrate-binding domain-containing protein [Oscillospiraceae bacterium]
MTKLFAGFSVLAMSALMLTGCGGPKPNPVHSADDLKGKHIGVQLGTTGDTFAGDIENATVEKYNKAADAVQALKQGKIDAVIVDLETAKSFVEKNNDIRILDEEFMDEEYAIAVQLDNTALRDELNEALKALTEDGTLDSIKANYEGDEQGEHPYEVKTNASRDKGTLIMATNAEFPPYESYSGGSIVGFDVDMMNAVCDYLGYTLKIEDMPFDSVLPAVQSGKAQVGVAGMSVTEDRAKNVLFTDNYAITHQVIIVRKD